MKRAALIAALVLAATIARASVLAPGPYTWPFFVTVPSGPVEPQSVLTWHFTADTVPTIDDSAFGSNTGMTNGPSVFRPITNGISAHWDLTTTAAFITNTSPQPFVSLSGWFATNGVWQYLEENDGVQYVGGQQRAFDASLVWGTNSAGWLRIGTNIAALVDEIRAYDSAIDDETRLSNLWTSATGLDGLGGHGWSSNFWNAAAGVTTNGYVDCAYVAEWDDGSASSYDTNFNDAVIPAAGFAPTSIPVTNLAGVVVGREFEFDSGQNDYISNTVPMATLSGLAGAFEWVSVPAVDDGVVHSEVALWNGSGGFSDGIIVDWDFGSGDDHVSIQCKVGNTAQWFLQTAVDFTDPYVGTRTHQVLTSDGTNVRYYVNAVDLELVSLSGTTTGAWTKAVIDGAADTFLWGGRASGTLALEGTMDAPRYYTRNLTAIEISQKWTAYSNKVLGGL